MTKPKDDNDRLRDGSLPLDPDEGTIPIGPDGNPIPTLPSVASLAAKGLALCEARWEKKELPVPVPWPLYAEILGGGLWPGMHVLVGGTGAGKTTWTTQIALEAASQGFPVAYIGLELDEAQIGLRVLGERINQMRRSNDKNSSNVGWSTFYLGKRSSAELKQAQEAIASIQSWPLFAEFGETSGWKPDRLDFIARFLTNESKKRATDDSSKTPLIVLDFLQLVDGDERELRERIGVAAYQARQIARQHHVAILVVSSAARDKYSSLADGCKEAGLNPPSGKSTIGHIACPDIIVGLGKESGEIEYAADSVTVLIRFPNPNNIPIVKCAVPKLRYGHPGWFATTFDGHAFSPLDFKNLPGETSQAKQGKATKSNKQSKETTVRQVPVTPPTLEEVAKLVRHDEHGFF